MGVLRIADSCQRFPPDGSPLSPTALNIMGDNLRALDEATRLGGYAFTGLYGQYQTENGTQTSIIWRGGGVYRAGMTTLRVTTHTIGTVAGGDTFRIYRGDTDANGNPPGTFSDFAVVAGTQTHNVTLSGYADGDVVRVMVELRHASTPGGSSYTGSRPVVTMAEFLPVTLPDAAPTLPTFSSAADLNQTKLNQLADYIDWLIRRAGTRYDPLFISQLRRNGPFRNDLGEADPNIKWHGGIRKSALHNTLRVRGRTLRLWTGHTESIRLWLNGSVVATYSVPTTLGESAFAFDHNISGYANDNIIRIDLDYVRTAPNVWPSPTNRWTISEIYVDSGAGGASTLGAWQVRQASVSAASILAWVQAARSLAGDIKARIDANGPLWAYQRLYTMRPVISGSATDTTQLQWYEEWSVPLTWRRQGEAVVGRGRALSLGYGAGWFDEAAYAEKAKTIEGVGAWPLKNTKTHSVVDDDAVESFQQYLDSVPGLPVGAPYNVRGWESWVLMERLKVVE